MARVMNTARKSHGGKGVRKYVAVKTLCRYRSTNSVVRKARKNLFGQVAHREVRCLYKIKEPLFHPKLFQRFLTNIVKNMNREIRLCSMAIAYLHDVFVVYLLGLFENANLCAFHENRKTIKTKDIHLSKRFRE